MIDRLRSSLAPNRRESHESGRRFGIRDGLFQAVAQGTGEQYLSAYALLFHATPFHLSVLSAVPQLLGTWAQLLSVKVARWFPSRKAQVLWSIAGQAVSWLPIVALPLFWPQQGPWLLIAAAALYFAFTHFGSPAWNGFITDLLDENERGQYFAKRARVMAVTGFITLCAGGGLLSALERRELPWAGFALLFLIAGLCRSASAWSLSAVPDVPTPHEDGPPTGFREFLHRGASQNFLRFLLFSGLMHAAVLLAGPFFVIYMLQDLHLPYWAYGTWLAAGIIGQFVTLTTWGQFGDRYGNKALLTITGFTVPILPMLYLFGTAWPFLVLVNFFGGIVWAGLSLGLQNYVFDAVQPADRAKAVAVVSFVNALGWAAGTFTGSWLIGTVPDALRIGSFDLHPASNLPFIFVLSGALRLLVSGALLGTFREPREVESRPPRHLLRELPLLKPLCRLALRRPTELGR